jgi:hypothetical protein
MITGTTLRRARNSRQTSWPAGPLAQRDVEQDHVEAGTLGLVQRARAVGHGNDGVALA